MMPTLHLRLLQTQSTSPQDAAHSLGHSALRSSDEESLGRSHLYKVLVAPGAAAAVLLVAVVHAQQRDVIPHIPPVECLVGILCVHLLVLGGVEDGIAHAQHCTHGCYLL